MVVWDQEQVKALLDLDALVDALGRALVDLSAGRASVPARIAAIVAESNGLLAAMPAYCPSAGVLACKLVSLYPGNAGGPIPTHQAVIVVFDPATGSPIALMDGTYITAVRTAAGSALATKLLAREDSRALAILGTGVQAWSHVRAIPRVRPIVEIRIAGRDGAKATAMAARVTDELGIEAMGCETWEKALEAADIVCACTHPHDPVVRREWLQPGMHVNSVGLSTDGQEVDLDTIREASVFVEQRSTAAAPMPTGSNDLYRAVKEGAVSLDSITEIGEVISGLKPGRRSDQEITLYKSVGVAVEDAAAAALVLAAAKTTA